MPLRIKDGVSIPVAAGAAAPPPGVLLDMMRALPQEGLTRPGQPGARLTVPLLRQLKELWCWAACAQMVLGFFGGALRQCEIARLQLNRACCDESAPASFCDEGRTLTQIDRAFARVGLAGLRIDRAASFKDLQREIGGRSPRPVVAGVRWAGGGGHLVVVTGWRKAGDVRYVRVNDPLHGAGDVRYTDLVEHYGRNDNGRWTNTWLEFERG